MARITSFEELETEEQPRRHTAVECGYRILRPGDETLVQLDTYGSRQRKIPGKVSQSIQLDRTAAETLIEILRKAFPDLHA